MDGNSENNGKRCEEIIQKLAKLKISFKQLESTILLKWLEDFVPTNKWISEELKASSGLIISRWKDIESGWKDQRQGKEVYSISASILK